MNKNINSDFELIDPFYLMESNFEIIQSYEVLFDNVEILLYNDDITKLKVDIIVSSDNSNLQMLTGVSKALLEIGGEIIRQEANLRLSQTPDENIIITSTGQLNSNYVFHGIIHDLRPGRTNPSPEDITRNCILLANSLRAKSIAIPIFGTGGFGLPFVQTSKAIISTIRNTLISNVTLEKIIISIPLHQRFEEFKDILNGYR